MYYLGISYYLLNNLMIHQNNEYCPHFMRLTFTLLPKVGNDTTRKDHDRPIAMMDTV